MHLSPYYTTYWFGQLACGIQGRQFDIEDRQRRGDFDAGSAPVGYQGSARMAYQNVGGGLLCRCWWRRRRKKGKLVQIVRKCNEYMEDK